MDIYERENPMVVEAYWKNPYKSTEPVAWCDRCGAGIHEGEAQHELGDEYICDDCFWAHVEEDEAKEDWDK
jgi:predicted RNA-binding Zn-ribbon protein involved in translation (DUF1610 family)